MDRVFSSKIYISRRTTGGRGDETRRRRNSGSTQATGRRGEQERGAAVAASTDIVAPLEGEGNGSGGEQRVAPQVEADHHEGRGRRGGYGGTGDSKGGGKWETQ